MQNKQPHITILVTSFNHEAYIKETILSIKNQTHSNRTCMIADDASTDNTKNIIAQTIKWDNRFQTFHQSHNLWLVGNMNNLFSHIPATSEYISFLEWDDVYENKNLEIRVDKIISSWVDAIITDRSYIDAESVPIQISWKKNNSKKYFKYWVNTNVTYSQIFDNIWSPIWSFAWVMIKTDIVRKNTPLPELNPTEKVFIPSDVLTRSRTLVWHNVYYLPKAVLKYRVHEYNQSWKWSREKSREQLKLIYKQYIKQWICVKYFTYMHNLLSCMWYAKKGEVKKTISHFLQLQDYPTKHIIYKWAILYNLIRSVWSSLIFSS